MHNNKPRSAADPRPNNKPYYINPTCPTCRAELVLSDLFEDPTRPSNEVWHDEFICPKCQDGIFMDWPKTMDADFQAKRNKAQCVDLETLRRRYLTEDND